MSNIPDHNQRSRVIRVLLVDDHTMIREGLRSLLEEYPNLQVVGEAANGEEAVMLVQTLRPSVVVMDINMPGMNGIQATETIKRQNAEIPIIGLSVNGDEHKNAILRAGARLFVSKEAAGERLYMAILEAVSTPTVQRAVAVVMSIQEATQGER